MSNTLPRPDEKRDFVQQMFARIAFRYDFMNKIISLGQDGLWRKKVVYLLQPKNHQRYLDIGAGTGDLAREIIQKAPRAQVVAADLTLAMIMYGREKKKQRDILWVVADAQALPFSENTFAGIVSGYLLRNVPDINRALCEQNRVLQNEARLVSLDTTPPDRNMLYPFILIYLKWIIPLIGKTIAGDARAYTYLPESTRNHLTVEALAAKFRGSGLVSVQYETMMFGTMSIHSAHKSAES